MCDHNNEYTNFSLYTGTLISGHVNAEHFHMLMSIFNIHNEKMILAMADFLIFGKTRRESCEVHGVSQSYFSIKLSQLQHMNKTIVSMLPYYSQIFEKI